MSDIGGKRGLVLGKSGSGKSQLFERVMLSQLKRSIIFDPEEEYDQLKGYVQIETIAALRSYIHANWKNDFKIVFVPKSSKIERDLDSVSALVWKLQDKPYKTGLLSKKVTLVVDELQLGFPLHPNPDFEWFSQVITRGRKRGINVIGMTQRPAKICTDFRGNLDTIHCLALSAPVDWKALREMMGGEAESELRTAAQFAYLEWVNGVWELKPPS